MAHQKTWNGLHRSFTFNIRTFHFRTSEDTGVIQACVPVLQSYVPQLTVAHGADPASRGHGTDAKTAVGGGGSIGNIAYQLSIG